MPVRTSVGRAASLAGATGLIAFATFAGGMSASAAPVVCEAVGAVTITTGVCEIRVTASNPTVTIPAGVTQLEALLVGGGGAGAASYVDDGPGGGFGGEVVYVNTVPVTGPITVVIGNGGVVGGTEATPTTISSGAFNASASGGTLDFNGTAGVVPSAAAGASAGFPALLGEAPVAGNGQEGEFYSEDPSPADPRPATGAGTALANIDALPVTGSGGGGASFDFDPQTNFPGGNGGSGLVIFRFTAFEVAALAASGVDSTAATVAAAGAATLLGGGVFAMLYARLRRSRA